MQKDDVNPKESQLVKDSVVREYEAQGYDYMVQPNDIIYVDFESVTPKDFNFLKSESNLNPATITSASALIIGELVDHQGNISFPFIGKVNVAGLTVFQIQEKLQAIANQYLESPVVKVRLLNYRITILGEVNKEGTITFPNNRVTMLEAIGMAGGLTDLADKRNLKLIRQIDGKVEVAYIDLLDENFISSPYYYVHQNDVLITGALRQRSFRKYFGQNFSLVVSSLTLFFLAISITR